MIFGEFSCFFTFNCFSTFAKMSNISILMVKVLKEKLLSMINYDFW